MASLYLTYVRTAWSRVLQKLTGPQLVKKFPTFYGTRSFITTFTSAATCPYPEPDQSSQCPPPHLTTWRSILILLSLLLLLGLPSGLFPSGFPTKTLYIPLLSPILATRSASLIVFDLITWVIVGEQYRSLSSSLCSFLHSTVTSSLLGPIFSSTPYSLTPSAYVPPLQWATKFPTHTKQQAKL